MFHFRIFFSDCRQRAESVAVIAPNEIFLESIQCENELVNHTNREKKKKEKHVSKKEKNIKKITRNEKVVFRPEMGLYQDRS